MSGATASEPRYGLTVTASAPRPSNSATAWRAAVRADVATLRVGHDRARRTGSSRGSARGRPGPADPYASKNARFGLTAAAYGAAASTMSRANASMPAEVAAEPGRQAGGVRVEAEAQDGADGGATARRVVRGSRPSRGAGRRRRPRPARSATGRGAAAVGRDEPVRPRRAVQARDRGQAFVSPTVQFGALPSSLAIWRSTIWPSMWKNAIAVAGRRPDGRPRGAVRR